MSLGTAAAEHGALAAWAADRTSVVLRQADSFVHELSLSPPLRSLLETACVGLRHQARQHAFPIPFVHLPLLVHAAIQGDDQPAVPLAAATALLYLGVDIFDDLADGDRPGHWGERRDAEINLAALALLCSLPQLVITHLDAPPTRALAMQASVAGRLLRMIEGQQLDVGALGSRGISVDSVEASVAGKSGEEAAMFTELAALFAGASEEVVRHYADFGRALGIAAQLNSDCHDLFVAPMSRDLASGARTLPIALYLERAAPREHGRFLDLLGEARIHPAAQQAVRNELRLAGILRRSAVIVQLYCQRASAALQRAAPHEAGGVGLRAMIRAFSLFRSTS